MARHSCKGSEIVVSSVRILEINKHRLGLHDTGHPPYADGGQVGVGMTAKITEGESAKKTVTKKCFGNS